jgi:protein SCO1/2
MSLSRIIASIVLCCLAASVGASPLPVNTRLGGDFTLPSTTGDRQSLSSWRGKVVLLNFGFTHCPDVCPMVISRMVSLLKEVDEPDAVQALFVSFDHERDTIPHLTSYLSAFDKRLVGMTGTAEQIAAVASQYGVVYIPDKSESAAGRLYTHSDFIYLLDRQGRVRALFGSDDRMDDMTDKIESLIEED